LFFCAKHLFVAAIGGTPPFLSGTGHRRRHWTHSVSWHRVRGTPPNDDQLRHAQEQLTLANQYLGRARCLPSDCKVIVLDTSKRSPKT
jgi:hypothetical protein